MYTINYVFHNTVYIHVHPWGCIYICLGVALNRRCAFQARETGGKFFFTMSLWIIWLNESLINFRWSTSTVDLKWRSSGIKGHFQHVFTPQWRSIPPNLISPLPQPKDPLPRTACFGDKRWSSAVVILRKTGGSVDREVLGPEIFPIPKIAENHRKIPLKTRHCLVFFDFKGSHDLIFTLSLGLTPHLGVYSWLLWRVEVPNPFALQVRLFVKGKKSGQRDQPLKTSS